MDCFPELAAKPFIDYNWGMPALNAFVSQSDLPVDMFTFGIPGTRARPPFNLNFSGIAMPSSISFPLSSVGASPISDIFPAPPQIPLGVEYRSLYIPRINNYVQWEIVCKGCGSTLHTRNDKECRICGGKLITKRKKSRPI